MDYLLGTSSLLMHVSFKNSLGNFNLLSKISSFCMQEYCTAGHSASSLALSKILLYHLVGMQIIVVFLYIFRDLDRERSKMEGQEKKVINDIKKMAKEGQMV